MNQLPHVASSETRYIFKQGLSLHDDHLIFPSSYAIQANASKTSIYVAYKFENVINTTIIRFYRTFTTNTLDAAGYWLMAQEYSIWNATIASLQFWTEDLDPGTLGIASECVYTTFFYTSTSQTLCQQSDETLFGCFIIMLNAAFTQQLLLVDEGYESGSNTINLPNPPWKTPCIHHVSSMEHASFNPVPTTPCSKPQTPPRPVCRCLSFSSADYPSPDNTPVWSDSSDEEEEDFQMVPLDDEHWTLEEVPEQTFCIHEHGLPHNLCQYPCPYGSNNTLSYMDSLDLSDILDYEDYMATSSDDEILGMEEVPY